jgi:hypothetical protein
VIRTFNILISSDRPETQLSPPIRSPKHLTLDSPTFVLPSSSQSSSPFAVGHVLHKAPNQMTSRRRERERERAGKRRESSVDQPNQLRPKLIFPYFFQNGTDNRIVNRNCFTFRSNQFDCFCRANKRTSTQTRKGDVEPIYSINSHFNLSAAQLFRLKCNQVTSSMYRFALLCSKRSSTIDFKLSDCCHHSATCPNEALQDCDCF